MFSTGGTALLISKARQRSPLKAGTSGMREVSAAIKNRTLRKSFPGNGVCVLAGEPSGEARACLVWTLVLSEDSGKT